MSFCLQVHVFGSGLRHTVSTTIDGRALQTPLQHLRELGRLHRGLPSADVGRGALARVPGTNPLPWLGRGAAAVPVQDPRHGHVPGDAHLRLLGHQVRNSIQQSKYSDSDSSVGDPVLRPEHFLTLSVYIFYCTYTHIMFNYTCKRRTKLKQDLTYI